MSGNSNNVPGAKYPPPVNQVFHNVFGRTKNRNSNEIAASILKVICDNTRLKSDTNGLSNKGFGRLKHSMKNQTPYVGLTATKIMYSTFISYKQLKEFLASLIQFGLISKLPDTTDEVKEYIITDKGLEFLRKFHEAYKVLGIDTLSIENERIFFMTKDHNKKNIVVEESEHQKRPQHKF